MKDKKKWMMAAVVATGALIGRICYECRHFTTEYYDVASDKIPEAFEGFRFVVLSDLHNYDFDQGNRQLLGAIERLETGCSDDCWRYDRCTSGSGYVRSSSDGP